MVCTGDMKTELELKAPDASAATATDCLRLWMVTWLQMSPGLCLLHGGIRLVEVFYHNAPFSDKT